MQRYFKDMDLENLIKEASTSDRLRKTVSLNDPLDPGCRSMINALHPGTYVQPHRHNEKGYNEWWFVLKGGIYPLSFTEHGEIISVAKISADEQLPLVENQRGVFHSLVVKSPSVILEFSRGPYNPKTFKESASWAPKENEEHAREYLKILEQRVAHLG